MPDYEALWRAERIRCEELEEALRQCKDKPRDDFGWLRLPPSQRSIWTKIVSSPAHTTFTRSELIEAMNGDGAENPDGVLAVQMSYLRKQLAKIGVKVETVQGIGYELTSAAVQAWELALEEGRTGRIRLEPQNRNRVRKS